MRCQNDEPLVAGVINLMAGKYMINLEVSYCKDQQNKWECPSARFE